jgi:hypothetical protein
MNAEVTLAWNYCLRGLTRRQLLCLRNALATRDPRIVMGKVCEPGPTALARDKPITRCCPELYALWQSHNFETVGEAAAMYERLAAPHRQAMMQLAHFLDGGEEAARRWAMARITDELDRREVLVGEGSDALA